MNKKEFIDFLASINETTKKAAAENLDMVLTGITEALACGKDVRIQGFGNFYTTVTPERDLRVPSTGEVVHVPEKKLPKFKAGKTFKEALQ